MQSFHVSAGKALCRVCGVEVSTNRLSTHIAREHPRPAPIDLRPTLVRRKTAPRPARPTK
jgi:hypothetical protein